jgi:hypothetical protein
LIEFSATMGWPSSGLYRLKEKEDYRRCVGDYA